MEQLGAKMGRDGIRTHEATCELIPYNIWCATKVRALVKKYKIEVVLSWRLRCDKCGVPAPESKILAHHSAVCENKRRISKL
jgi:hypothetical protein